MSELLKQKALEFKMKLTLIWSTFAILYISAVTFIEVPITNNRVVDQVLGFVMGTIVATGLNYWIGNSAEQDTKRENQNESVKSTESESNESIG